MARRIRPGAMDREIVIQEQSVTRGTNGEEVITWGTFASVWAEVTPEAATEAFQADARHSRRVSVFRVWHLDGVLPTMQISYESLSWRILGIVEVGRREALDIRAEAIY